MNISFALPSPSLFRYIVNLMIRRFLKEELTLPLILILLLALVLSILAFVPLLNSFGDNARYMIASQSMATGQGFLQLNFPDKPPELKYPFGFPLLLVPVYLLFGLNVVAHKILITAFYLLAVFFFYLLVKKDLDRPLAYLATLLLASQPFFLAYASKVMTEVPYGLFSILAVLFFLKAEEEGEKIRTPHFVLFLFFSIYSFFIRTNGISLIGALFLHLLLTGKLKKVLVFSSSFIVSVFFWSLRFLIMGKGATYLDEFFHKDLSNLPAGYISFSDFLVRLRENSVYYFKDVARHLLSRVDDLLARFDLSPMGIWIYGIAVAILLLGIIFAFRRKRYVYGFHVLFFGLIIIYWPWQSNRMFIPLTPFLILTFVLGINDSFRLLEGRLRASLIRIPVFMLVLLVLFLNFYGDAEVIKTSLDYRLKGKFIYDSNWERYYQALYWIRDNTPQDSVVLTRGAAVAYVLTGRKTLLYAETTDPQKMKKYLDGADYVIQENTNWKTRAYLVPALLEYGSDFEIVHVTEKPYTFIWRHLRGEELVQSEVSRIVPEDKVFMVDPETEQATIDLADPSNQNYLNERWSKIGATGVWAVHREPYLFVDLSPQNTYRVEISMASLGIDNLPQKVKIYLDQVKIGESLLEAGQNVVKFEIPQEVLKNGPQSLRMVCSYVIDPEWVGQDLREDRVSVQVRYIRFSKQLPNAR